MSLDFYVWRAPTLTAEQVSERLMLLGETDLEEEAAFEWSSRVIDFRRAILKRYPPLEELADGADQPWAMTPPESGRVIELNLRASAPRAQLNDVLMSAARHGLYIYNPQRKKS
jgi:hypothetical protein